MLGAWDAVVVLGLMLLATQRGPIGRLIDRMSRIDCRRLGLGADFQTAADRDYIEWQTNRELTRTNVVIRGVKTLMEPPGD